MGTRVWKESISRGRGTGCCCQHHGTRAIFGSVDIGVRIGPSELVPEDCSR